MRRQSLKMNLLKALNRWVTNSTPTRTNQHFSKLLKKVNNLDYSPSWGAKKAQLLPKLGSKRKFFQLLSKLLSKRGNMAYKQITLQNAANWIKEKLDKELEKSYADMLAGRTKPAEFFWQAHSLASSSDSVQ